MSSLKQDQPHVYPKAFLNHNHLSSACQKRRLKTQEDALKIWDSKI